MTAYAEGPGRDYRKERDAAYGERNRLVAGLARLIVGLLGVAGLVDMAVKAWRAL